MYGTTWTPEEEEQLKTLYKKGFKFHEIGAIMGKTKGQISGKCDRLGLCVSKAKVNDGVLKYREIILPPPSWRP